MEAPSAAASPGLTGPPKPMGRALESSGQIFFQKGPHSNSFRLHRHYGLCRTAQLCRGSHRQWPSGWACLCSNKALFIKTDDMPDLAHALSFEVTCSESKGLDPTWVSLFTCQDCRWLFCHFHLLNAVNKSIYFIFFKKKYSTLY